MRYPVFALALFASTAFAEEPPLGATGEPENLRAVTVFGDDTCPKPDGDEIVVCGRLPESERYRIPKALRKKPRVDSGPGASWGSRVESLEAAQRFSMPNSCTAFGSGGQSGCTSAMLRQWFLERRNMARTDAP